MGNTQTAEQIHKSPSVPTGPVKAVLVDGDLLKGDRQEWLEEHIAKWQGAGLEVQVLERPVKNARELFEKAGLGDAYPHLPERLSAGKTVLHITSRASSFVDTFEPPHGVVCHRFNKAVLATGCPFDCEYCYLQLTYRINPYLRIYANLDRAIAELKRLDTKTEKPLKIGRASCRERV